MFGQSSQCFILKAKSMVCSSHVRIALTTKSQTHRNEALGKASRAYEVVLTHLSAPGLTYEELSCLTNGLPILEENLKTPSQRTRVTGLGR
jgi:hypothetical protein